MTIDIIATKKAKAFNAVNILKNNESGHHCKASTSPADHWTVSTDNTHHKIHVTQKNSNDQYTINTNDFNEVFTFSGSFQSIISLIPAITKYNTNKANQIYLTTSRIFPHALAESHHGTIYEFG
jgi:hypothetical protein